MLELLISSSVLIVVVALLRRLLRGRISARLQYALWALVLLRLLIPVNLFESRVSVSAAAEPIAVQIREFSARQVQTVYLPVDFGENPETGESIQAVGRSYVEPLDVLRWLWFGGMGAVALWFAAENLLMARRLRKGRQYWGSHESFPVYLSPSIPSPCLFGLFRPAIYLTEPAASDDALTRRVLAHEYTHICHFDMLWSLLRGLCLVVWWFNPLVWWAAALSRRDAELACDEGAIRRLGEAQRFEYGRTLLSLATVKTRPRDLLCSATTMTGGSRSLRERIEYIARTKKLSVRLAVLCLAVAAVAAGCTFSGGQDAVTPETAFTPQPNPASSSDTALMPQPDPDSSSDTGFIFSQSIDAELSEALLAMEGGTTAYVLYSQYLSDFTDPDPSRWLTWLRFESDMEKQLSLDNYHPLLSAEILSVEKINDKLFAFTVLAENTTGLPAEKFFNFLVLDPEEGSYVIRNVSSIPEDLSENLDPARYDPQLLMADGMIALGAPDQTLFSIYEELMAFAEPVFVSLTIDDSYSDKDTSAHSMTFSDLVYCTDSWEKTLSPEPPLSSKSATLTLHSANGDALWLFADLDALYLVQDGQWIAAYHFGMEGSEMFNCLYAWASDLVAIYDLLGNNSHMWNFFQLYYAAAHESSPDASLVYVFTSDESAYRNNYEALPFGYGVAGLGMINENLCAFILYESPDDPVLYRFVGNYEGQLRVFMSAKEVPAEISAGLVPSDYEESDPQKISDTAIQNIIALGESA